MHLAAPDASYVDREGFISTLGRLEYQVGAGFIQTKIWLIVRSPGTEADSRKR